MSLVGASAGGDDRYPRRVFWKKQVGSGPTKPLRKKQKEKGGLENSTCPYIRAQQHTWGKWVSEIRDPNNRSKRLWLGPYDTAREAAMAHDTAAWRLYEEAARLNFPKLGQQPAPAQPPEVSTGGATTSATTVEEEDIWEGLGDLLDGDIRDFKKMGKFPYGDRF